jgi:hypothetical protein
MKLKPRCCCKGERICRVDSRASYSWVNGPCTSASGYQEWTSALLPHLLHWNSEFETAFSLYASFYVGYNVNDSSPITTVYSWSFVSGSNCGHYVLPAVASDVSIGYSGGHLSSWNSSTGTIVEWKVLWKSAGGHHSPRKPARTIFGAFCLVEGLGFRV